MAERESPEQLAARVGSGWPSGLKPVVDLLQGDHVVLKSTVDERHHAGNGYLHAGAVVTLADTAAVIGDSSALTIDDLVHAVALGRPAELSGILDRLLSAGEAPVRLLRSVANHVARLHRLAGGVAAGEPAARVLEKARPPIHFRRKDSFRTELARWSSADLAAALGRLIEAEIACKTTGQPAELSCRMALLAICGGVAAGRHPSGGLAGAGPELRTS